MLEVVLLVAVVVLLREVGGHAHRPSPGHDGHLVHRVRLGEQDGNQRVAGLVVGRDALLFLLHHHRFPLRTHENLVPRPLEVRKREGGLVVPRRAEGGFVHEVLEVRPGESGSAASHDAQLHPLGHQHLGGVNLEDILSPPHIREGDVDLAVKASGTQQRRIEHIRSVGGRNDNGSFV